jgi:hypothetical protein
LPEPLIRSTSGELPDRIGDLLIQGPPTKVNRDPMVTLKCVHVIDGTTCNRVFKRRLYRLSSSQAMCQHCAMRERQRPRCSSCGSLEHARDKCDKKPLVRKKCQLCFGTSHMVEGPTCEGCGLAYVPETMPTARTPVEPRPAYVPPRVITVLSPTRIHCDGGTQARVMLDAKTISEYAEQIAAGAKFPEPVVYYDGKDYWLGDGFHRVYAHIQAGTKKIPCEVRGGGKREAVLYAVGANAIHGLKRTNADKHRAVEMLLIDKDWGRNSDRWIAERCAVTHPFVRRIRSQLKQLEPVTSSKVAKAATEPATGRETRTGMDGHVRRLPVRTTPAFSHERVKGRLEGTVDAILGGWPADASLTPLALWLDGLAVRVRGLAGERASAGR